MSTVGGWAGGQGACIVTFIAILFFKKKNQKQPKCPHNKGIAK